MGGVWWVSRKCSQECVKGSCGKADKWVSTNIAFRIPRLFWSSVRVYRKCSRWIGGRLKKAVHVLATYSGVKLVVPKNSLRPTLAVSKGLDMPGVRGSVKLLGWTMRSCPEIRFETTPDPLFSADDLHTINGDVKKWSVESKAVPATVWLR